MQQFIGQQGITVRQRGNTTINGIAAVFAEIDATTESGALRGLVFSLQHRNVTYLLIGITTAQGFAQYGSAIDGAIRSFKDVSDPAVLNAQPSKVQIVTLPSQMTGQEFVQRYPSTIPVEQVYIINGIDASTSVPRGTLMKRVTGGSMP